MRVTTRLISFVLAALIPLACTTTDPARVSTAKSSMSGAAYPDKIDEYGMPVPMGPDQRSGRQGNSPRLGETIYADGPYEINVAALPRANRPDWAMSLTGPANKRSHAPGPISEERMAELRARAKNLPENANIPHVRQAPIGDILAGAPASVDGFEGPDSGDCCGGTSVSVPPDPEMAAGLNHVVAAVNSAFVIYDKATGAVAQGPITFEDFFSGFSQCQGTFDPNVIYDQSADRFFMGIVGNGSGTHYCMAVSKTGDPTGLWNHYALKVDIDGDFFDYPHAGVGVDAIYISSNMFANSFTQSILWAVDKSAMYAGGPLAAKSASVGMNFTPQPMNIHGGTFPPSGTPHYFVATVISGGQWSAEDLVVYQWTDPFNTNSTPSVVSGLSFTTSSDAAYSVGFPTDQPQRGNRRAAVLDGGDWRIQDAEYSAEYGFISIAQTVSCNPGGGTVNCIRWADIELNGSGTAFAINDSGIIASPGEYRSYADSAVNSCGDIAFGYTKTSDSMYPGVWAAAREGGLNGTVGSEFELKAGEETYKSFQSWRQANRWGDYTGMTIDPDGETFWYLGEYAKANGLSTNWGTHIASFKLASCDSGGGGGGGGGDVTIDQFVANPGTIDAGQNTTLTWASTNATSCTASGDWSGSKSVDGSQVLQLDVAGDYTFGLYCEDGSTFDTAGANVTVNAVGSLTEIGLSGLEGASSAANRGRWTATVTATVTDVNSAPVPGVIVSGNWANGTSGGGSCETTSNGSCTITKNNLKSNVGSVTFSVSGLAAPAGYEYNGNNSASTSVTINQ